MKSNPFRIPEKFPNIRRLIEANEEDVTNFSSPVPGCSLLITPIRMFVRHGDHLIVFDHEGQHVRLYGVFADRFCAAVFEFTEALPLFWPKLEEEARAFDRWLNKQGEQRRRLCQLQQLEGLAKTLGKKVVDA